MFKRSDDEIKSLFYKLKTRSDVANILEMKEVGLRYLLYVKRPENLYTEFIIKKKNGDDRIIFAPESRLKNIQRKLAYILSLNYDQKVCAYGFIKDKNILQNANNHCKKNQVLNIDLKDFFKQIHFGRVRGMLISEPYSLSDEAATTISQLACYNGSLPQGAPSSPVITNMICKSLDNQLMRLAKNNKSSYTRYVDDITFSTSKAEFPKGIVYGLLSDLKIGKDLKNVLKKNSFVVNEDKIFLNSRFTRQEVTGLTVNQFPNVKREYIKKVRALLHRCKKDGIYQTALHYIEKGLCKSSYIISLSKQDGKEEIIDNWFKGVLKGKISFVKQIKGENNYTFLNFALKLNELFMEDIFNEPLVNAFNTRVENNVFILKYENDEALEYIQGTAFILQGHGLVTNYHVTEGGEFFKVYKCSDYDSKFVKVISKDSNEVKFNEIIDYALYEYEDSKDCFQIGDSNKLRQGDFVTIIGYPRFQKGDSPYIQRCEITSKTTYMQEIFYTVGGRVVHGASGGLVLNKDKQVVGLLKGGIESLNEELSTDKQGFVPIHIIIDNIKDNVRL